MLKSKSSKQQYKYHPIKLFARHIVLLTARRQIFQLQFRSLVRNWHYSTLNYADHIANLNRKSKSKVIFQLFLLRIYKYANILTHVHAYAYTSTYILLYFFSLNYIHTKLRKVIWLLATLQKKLHQTISTLEIQFASCQELLALMPCKDSDKLLQLKYNLQVGAHVAR